MSGALTTSSYATTTSTKTRLKSRRSGAQMRFSQVRIASWTVAKKTLCRALVGMERAKRHIYISQNREAKDAASKPMFSGEPSPENVQTRAKKGEDDGVVPGPLPQAVLTAAARALSRTVTVNKQAYTTCLVRKCKCLFFCAAEGHSGGAPLFPSPPLAPSTPWLPPSPCFLFSGSPIVLPPARSFRSPTLFSSKTIPMMRDQKCWEHFTCAAISFLLAFYILSTKLFGLLTSSAVDTTTPTKKSPVPCCNSAAEMHFLTRR